MRKENEATSSDPRPQVLDLGAACISTAPTPVRKPLGLGVSVEEATHLYRYGGALRKCGSPW